MTEDTQVPAASTDDVLSPDERRLRGLPEKAPAAKAEGSAPSTDTEADTSKEAEAPDADETGADQPEGDEGDQPKKPKDRVQKRFDTMTRRIRELERALVKKGGEAVAGETQPRQEAPQPAATEQKPRLEDFANYEAFNEALTEWKVDQKLNANAQKRQQQERQRSNAQLQSERRERFQDSSEKARDKYDDYDELVMSDKNKVTPTMAALIADTDEPGEIAYYLAKNPEEARRIASLPPTKAAMAIGKLEDKLAAPPAKRVSSAPDPAKPVARGGGGKTVALEKLSPDDFYTRRQAQIQGKA